MTTLSFHGYDEAVASDLESRFTSVHEAGWTTTFNWRPTAGANGDFAIQITPNLAGNPTATEMVEVRATNDWSGQLGVGAIVAEYTLP